LNSETVKKRTKIMLDFLYQPWPWYVAGPIIGLTVPILLLLGGKMFGVSANLRHACAACNFGNVEFFNYDWKTCRQMEPHLFGGNRAGRFLGGYVFANPEPIQLAASTITDLQALGIQDFNGLVPDDLFTWDVLERAYRIHRTCSWRFSGRFGADMPADVHPAMQYRAV
jgi:uncharacterized protein